MYEIRIEGSSGFIRKVDNFEAAKELAKEFSKLTNKTIVVTETKVLWSTDQMENEK